MNHPNRQTGALPSLLAFGSKNVRGGAGEPQGLGSRILTFPLRIAEPPTSAVRRAAAFRRPAAYGRAKVGCSLSQLVMRARAAARGTAKGTSHPEAVAKGHAGLSGVISGERENLAHARAGAFSATAPEAHHLSVLRVAHCCSAVPLPSRPLRPRFKPLRILPASRIGGRIGAARRSLRARATHADRTPLTPSG